MKYKYIPLSLLNSIVQYFNYSLFALSALLLSKEFVAGESEKHRLLNFFVILIISVLARPIGSVIFGSIGDILGRKPAIILAGIISSFGTISVYFIPSHSEIGLLATILLLASRVLFISGLSGEIDGVRIYVSEIVPKNKQNFGNGIVTFFTQVGPLIASILISEVGNQNWRLFFLSGGLAGFIFTFIRVFLPESSEFKKRAEDPNEYYRITLIQILLGQFFLIFRLIFIFGTIGCLYQFYIIFLPSYLFLEGNQRIKEFVPYFIILYAIGGLIFGYIADIIGSEKIIFSSIITLILLSIIFSINLSAGNQNILPFLIMVICFFNASLSVPAQIYIKSKINVAIRLRLFSLSHSLGSLILSSPLPFIASNISINYGISNSTIYPISSLILCLISLKSLFNNTSKN